MKSIIVILLAVCLVGCAKSYQCTIADTAHPEGGPVFTKKFKSHKEKNQWIQDNTFADQTAYCH